MMSVLFVFFFSSRRRHTRSLRDWSSDVCSSDLHDAHLLVTGFDPAEFADREALRAELGYAPDEKVCIVTVGGSGVGADLLRRSEERRVGKECRARGGGYGGR